MDRPDLVVVGGGLAGIAAALAAADVGAQVVLLERRPHLGGVASSFFRRGRWSDHGQHVFLRCCTAYRSLIDRFGGTAHLSLQDRLAIPVVVPGREPQWLRRDSLPAPLHLAVALARYGHLSPGARVRLGRAAWALRRLDTDDPRLDDITFADWLRAHGQGSRSIEALWDLIALPTLNVRSEDASLLAAARTFQMGLLSDAGAADLGWASVPLSHLHDGLARPALEAAGVDVRLRLGAAGVEVTKGRPRVLTDRGTHLDPAAVILALPHDVAPQLLPAPERGGLQHLAGLGASPIVDLHLLYDRPVLPFPVAACLDSMVQWVFDRSPLLGAGPGRYLVLSLSAAEIPMRLTAAALLARAQRDLERLFPPARGASLLDAHVGRSPRATFRASVGTDRLREVDRGPIDGVFLAGSWTATGWPATMEGAVRSGTAAAAAAVAHIDRGE